MRAHLASLLFVSATALAQQESLPPLVEKINVSVINVDATVLDAKGHPVSNLTSKDFQLFEDGKPQTITNFYAVERSIVRDEVAGSTPSPVTQRFRRKAVLLVDNHFIDKHSRDAALTQLLKFIDSDYAGDYDWSIGVIGAGVHVIQQFTADKAVIHATINRMLRGRAGQQIASVSSVGIGADSSQGIGASSESELAGAQIAADMVDMDNNLRFSSTLEALRASARAVADACRAFASLEGKKLIVLVTGSMEMENRGAKTNGIGTFARTPADNDREASSIREVMIREANAANFNIYIVKASGVTSPVAGFEVDVHRPDDLVIGDVRDNDSIASGLSQETGGAYLTSSAVGQSIRAIDTMSGTFYSLGYSPKHFEDGKYHQISVRVNQPGYTVRSRSGYLDASDAMRLEDSLRVAASATIPAGPLPLTVTAGPKSGEGRTFHVPVTVSLPMNSITLLKRNTRNVGRVHIYLSVFDQSDAAIGFDHAVQEVGLTDAQVSQIAADPVNFRYTMKVELKPGLYRVVMAVRDELSDEVGKAATVVDTRN